MAVDKVLFSAGLCQILASLCSLALCTAHYTNTNDMHTTVGNAAVMLACIGLPAISLLVCGIIGVLTAFIQSKAAVIIHTAITTQTSVGIAVDIWFYAYQTNSSLVQYNRQSAIYCLFAAVPALVVCMTYLTFRVVEFCAFHQKKEPANRKEIA